MKHPERPTIGVLAGLQFYRTAIPFNYHTLVYRGILAAAQARGVNLLLACGTSTKADPDPAPHPAWPIAAPEFDFVPIGPWNTDGLIVINPLLMAGTSQYIQDLIAGGHPVAYIGGGGQGATVLADNRSGIFQAIGHLVEHGHTSIAFIAGNSDDVEGDSGERLSAFRQAIAEYGLPERPELIAFGRHAVAGGQIAMRQILDSRVPFTAVLASNDESAIGAMQVLNETGRKIPEEVAIIGFDDRPEAVAQTPELASIHIPFFEMGYQAVDLLLRHIEGRDKAIHRLRIPTRLIARPSCGCHEFSISTSTRPAGPQDQAQLLGKHEKIEQTLTDAVLAETQSLSAEQVRTSCRAILASFLSSLRQGRSLEFQQTIDDLLAQTEESEVHAHIWQAAITVLRNSLPELLEEMQGTASSTLALSILDQARVLISERGLKQLEQKVISQKSASEQLGLITADLLQATDESQIFEALARHLPDLGLERAEIVFFDAQEDDPVAWSILHRIPGNGALPLRFPTRQFPTAGLYPENEAFSLALLPLVNQYGPSGYVVFDTTNLEIYGVIVQQIVTALKSARHYREAVEGRRLAEEASQLKSRFLSMVSHELRTPLNLIVGLSDIVLHDKSTDGKVLPDVYRKDIERINSSAHHLGWLIRDVLDMASNEAGQLRLISELLDLGEILQVVAESGRQMAQDRGLGWQESLPESGLWVWGDRTRLRQVAFNLVSNAVKFTAKGEVTLSVDVEGDSAVVRVSDTGLGIPAGEQELIFSEFYRAERATAHGYSGLGLGLAICRRLIELHGGEIGVTSSGEEGSGSTFFFRLPVVRPEAVRDDRVLAETEDRSVLILTNHAGNTDLLRERLHQRGVEVCTIWMEEKNDWQSQLLHLSSDGVIVDVSIAPSQGWEVLKRLKGNPATQHIPVLFCALTPDQCSMLELEYLTKPVSTEDLSQAISSQGIPWGDSGERAILIVEDDPATLEMHIRLVQTQVEECRILQARNGREALDVLENEHPDLVLLDLMMPEVDGFSVLEAMREKEQTRDIPVIVLTGQMLTEKEMARLNRGVATVLSKGVFSSDEILEHIDTVLERKQKLSNEAQRLVRKAMAYLHQHYTEPISRKELARHVGLSDDYLTYCFRKETGLTPVTYLTRYRINQAQALLKNSDQSITEIALAVGFSDSGYFSRVFRREVGMPPDIYRQG
jgi:signal transduction histidine kinase/DNA-binding LacI/PurR family transcriptional regulator/CheY-like chemotaxis protein